MGFSDQVNSPLAMHYLVGGLHVNKGRLLNSPAPGLCDARLYKYALMISVKLGLGGVKFQEISFHPEISVLAHWSVHWSVHTFTGPFTPWQPYVTTTSFSSRTHVDLYGAVGPPM